MLLGGLAMLCTAWAVTSPDGAAPDEPANYVKALAVGQGELLGAPVTVAEAPPGLTIWFKSNSLAQALSRQVSIPPDLNPQNAGCFAFIPASAACVTKPSNEYGKGGTVFTYLGTYQPFVYFVPGVAMHTASNPQEAFVIGRLSFAAIGLALMGTGIFLLLSGGGVPLTLLGILGAITPMVIFVLTSLSASSTEIAAGFGTFAAMLYLVYDGSRRRLGWSLLGVSGLLLSCSRPLGPAWILLIGGTAILLVGRHDCAARIRRGGRWALVSGILILIGSLMCIVWQVTLQPHPAESVSAFVHAFWHGWTVVGSQFQQEIGVFGWLDTFQSSFVYVGWGWIIASMIAFTYYVGTVRERITLTALIAANLIIIPVGYAVLAAPIHSGAQGRWFLGFAVGLPLFCGVVLAAHAPILREKAVRLATAFGAVFTVVQLLAIFQNSRRYAVGPVGTIDFIQHAQWSPPGGWIPWCIVALLACALLVAGVAILARSEDSLTDIPVRA